MPLPEDPKYVVSSPKQDVHETVENQENTLDSGGDHAVVVIEQQSELLSITDIGNINERTNPNSIILSPDLQLSDKKKRRLEEEMLSINKTVKGKVEIKMKDLNLT
jgi:hypothetical protein